MATVQDIDDSTAASMVLMTLTQSLGLSPTKKGGFLNLSKKATFDIVVKPFRAVDSKYACFTYFAVEGGKAKSSTAVFGEMIVKEVVKKLLEELPGFDAVAAAKGLVNAPNAVQGKVDYKNDMDEVRKLAGQMQLHAAKQTGKDVYEQCKVWGMGASVKYGGAVRFEVVRDDSVAFLETILTWWSGLNDGSLWVSYFSGNGGADRFRKIDQYSSSHRKSYTYHPAIGLVAD